MPTRWVGIFLSWHMGFMGRLRLKSFLIQSIMLIFVSLGTLESGINVHP